jgi:hypothetical protein
MRYKQASCYMLLFTILSLVCLVYSNEIFGSLGIRVVESFSWWLPERATTKSWRSPREFPESQISRLVTTAAREGVELQRGTTTRQANDSPPVTVNGQYLKAFLVAHQAFEVDVDIPQEKKKIDNYRVIFSQQDGEIIVLFLAVRLPSELSLKGGSSTFGKDVRYRVRKKDYQIISKNFFK